MRRALIIGITGQDGRITFHTMVDADLEAPKAGGFLLTT